MERNRVLRENECIFNREFVVMILYFIKGAAKLYFTHYLCVVIILFNTGLYKSVFSTYLFGKLIVLSFCAYCVYFFYVVLVDTGRKLNVHKTSWTSSERLMYVQFTSCIYGGILCNLLKLL